MKKMLWAAAILATAIILQFAVPAFQSPDEPHHFAAILIAAKGEGARAWAEKETIRLMDRHDWWRPAGVGRPGVLPERLSDIEFLMEGSKSGDFLVRLNDFVLFHRVLGWFLRLSGTDRVDRLYFLCRAVSLVLYLGAVFFIFLTLRFLMGIWKIPNIPGFLFVVFLPQFALVSTSVGPDPFVLCLSSIFFWGAVRLIAGRASAALVLILVLAAGLGFLSDRSAFFMGALLLVLPFFIMRLENRQQVAVYTLLFAVAAVLLLYAAALRFPLSVERSVLTLRGVVQNAGTALPRLLSPDQYQVSFWLFLIDTFFLRFGWLAFGAPVWVNSLWRVVCLAAGAGFLVYAGKGMLRRIRNDQNEQDGGGANRIRIVLFSILGILLQIGGLWVFYGTKGIQAQGRYLFPLIVPVVLIAIVGIHTLGEWARPGRGGRIALASGLVLEIFFFSYVLWAWIMPTFNLTVQGRFPGI